MDNNAVAKTTAQRTRMLFQVMSSRLFQIAGAIFWHVFSLIARANPLTKCKKIDTPLSSERTGFNQNKKDLAKEDVNCICLSPHSQESRTLPCSRQLHSMCLAQTKLLKPSPKCPTCPLCRAQLLTPEESTKEKAQHCFEQACLQSSRKVSLLTLGFQQALS